MTDTAIFDRLRLSPAERVAVRVAVEWSLRARRATVGQGQRYEGPVAWHALDRVATDDARWYVMAQAVRDACRARRGEALARPNTGGHGRTGRQLNRSADVIALAGRVGVEAAARRCGIAARTVRRYVSRARAA